MSNLKSDRLKLKQQSKNVLHNDLKPIVDDLKTLEANSDDFESRISALEAVPSFSEDWTTMFDIDYTDLNAAISGPELTEVSINIGDVPVGKYVEMIAFEITELFDDGNAATMKLANMYFGTQLYVYNVDISTNRVATSTIIMMRDANDVMWQDQLKAIQINFSKDDGFFPETWTAGLLKVKALLKDIPTFA